MQEYAKENFRLGWVQPTSASFVLGLQRIAIALLRNFEIGHVNCCSGNACVFLPFENIGLVAVMCGYRLLSVNIKMNNFVGNILRNKFFACCYVLVSGACP